MLILSTLLVLIMPLRGSVSLHAEHVSVRIEDGERITVNFHNFNPDPRSFDRSIDATSLHHIWWLPAAEVFKTGLTPHSVAAVPAG